MLTIVLIGLGLYTALIVIVLSICAAASAGDRQVIDDDVAVFEPALAVAERPMSLTA